MLSSLIHATLSCPQLRKCLLAVPRNWPPTLLVSAERSICRPFCSLHPLEQLKLEKEESTSMRKLKNTRQKLYLCQIFLVHSCKKRKARFFMHTPPLVKRREIELHRWPLRSLSQSDTMQKVSDLTGLGSQVVADILLGRQCMSCKKQDIITLCALYIHNSMNFYDEDDDWQIWGML